MEEFVTGGTGSRLWFPLFIHKVGLNSSHLIFAPVTALVTVTDVNCTKQLKNQWHGSLGYLYSDS